ncbi:MAG: putative transcriptional regulator [Rhodobacteraceae bacterium HLUCCA08]|nr:MAG: putative transcriptional regulator [Rhodobacteraceae bacterium HLUCCA08]
MTDPLDPLLGALADPTRRRILARLALGEATVNDLTDALPISQPAVSRHLRILTEAGLVERSARAQQRPARLVPGALKPVEDWAMSLRDTYETRFAQLDRVLAAMPDDPDADTPDTET